MKTAEATTKWLALAICMAAASMPAAFSQTAANQKFRLDIYGFAMLDMGYETKQSDPDWFDVMRPTKLPSFEDEFGGDGRTYAGVRQSRFGVKGFFPTSKGEIKTIFEFELFGVGVDAGQTTFRLRHAWGEWQKIGAGQTWSPFMDPDVFPNSIEYWGPNGMVFFRNVQIRYMPLQGKNELFVALERPGASGDPGVFVGAPEIANLSPRFPLPDLTGHYRMNRDWGHVQIGGIVRKMSWDDTDPNAPNLSGNDIGWGVNLSSNLKFAKSDVLRLQVVYGEGIANYMNDATADVGATFNVVTGTGNSDIGEAIPLLGVVAFYDHTWSDRYTSSIGYSMVDMDNTEAQDPAAFEKGQYALVNLLVHPTQNLMWGGEVQWGDRENFDDGFSSDDVRFQVSLRYNFSHTMGG
jgi:hypothetical protein